MGKCFFCFFLGGSVPERWFCLGWGNGLVCELTRREGGVVGKRVFISDIRRMTAAQVAALFGGISHNAVGRWPKKGCPRNEDRSFDGSAVFKWYLEHEKGRAVEEVLKKGGGSVGEDGEGRSESQYDEEYKRYRAGMKRLDYEKRKGALIPAADAERREVKLAAAFKGNLLGWPSHLAGRLFGLEIPEIKKVLDEAVREILGNLTR